MSDIILNCGEQVILPTGYYDKSVSIKSNTLASQTNANATASDIVTGKTAWINGNRLTGTFSGVNGTEILSRHIIFNYENFLYPTSNPGSISPYNGTTVSCNANTNKFMIIVCHLIREYRPSTIYYTGYSWSQGYMVEPYIKVHNFANQITISPTVHSMWLNVRIQCNIIINSVKGGNITTTANCVSIDEGASDYAWNTRECYMELWQLR